MTSARVTCMHAGRRVKKNTEATGNHGTGHGHTEGKGGGARRPTGCAQKRNQKKIKAPPEDTQHRANRERENE